MNVLQYNPQRFLEKYFLGRCRMHAYFISSNNESVLVALRVQHCTNHSDGMAQYPSDYFSAPNEEIGAILCRVPF